MPVSHDVYVFDGFEQVAQLVASELLIINDHSRKRHS